MICATIKQGYDCAFMTKKGCQYNGGSCKPIVDKCEGCQKAVAFSDGTYCISFPDPTTKWRFGNCNMATHVKAETKKDTARINPIKASKRGAR